MTDPTPEERAQTAMDGMFDLATIQFSIADQIRAAVAAERERILDHIQETMVGWGISRSMYDDLLAAIRKEPNEKT